MPTTLGDPAFMASAPKLWKDLPLEIRIAKFLNTHLFSKGFHFSTYTLSKTLKDVPCSRAF